MIVNMDAELIQRTKQFLPNGAIVEIVVWKVPSPVFGSSHLYKYRLYYGINGKRLIGFDNERGKGDHAHLDGTEIGYHFQSLEKLLLDFQVEIDKRVFK